MTKSIFTAKYERFRLLLIAARQNAGLKQSDVAGRLMQPQSYVSKYERGERRLDVVEFMELAPILGVDVCDFLRQVSEDGP